MYKTEKVLVEEEAVVNNRKIAASAVIQRREKSGREEESEQVWSAPFVMVKIEIGKKVIFWHPDIAQEVFDLLSIVVDAALIKKEEMDREFEERRKNRNNHKRRKQPVRSPGKTQKQREKERSGGKTYEQRKAEKSAESRRIRNEMRSSKGSR